MCLATGIIFMLLTVFSVGTRRTWEWNCWVFTLLSHQKIECLPDLSESVAAPNKIKIKVQFKEASAFFACTSYDSTLSWCKGKKNASNVTNFLYVKVKNSSRKPSKLFSKKTLQPRAFYQKPKHKKLSYFS